MGESKGVHGMVSETSLEVAEVEGVFGRGVGEGGSGRRRRRDIGEDAIDKTVDGVGVEDSDRGRGCGGVREGVERREEDGLEVVETGEVCGG